MMQLLGQFIEKLSIKQARLQTCILRNLKLYVFINYVLSIVCLPMIKLHECNTLSQFGWRLLQAIEPCLPQLVNYSQVFNFVAPQVTGELYTECYNFLDAHF